MLFLKCTKLPLASHIAHGVGRSCEGRCPLICVKFGVEGFFRAVLRASRLIHAHDYIERNLMTAKTVVRGK